MKAGSDPAARPDEDAAGSKQATLLGISEGGPMSLLLAATHPHRVNKLILYGAAPASAKLRTGRGDGVRALSPTSLLR